jgi:glutaredoxin-like protein NrdH
MPIPVLALDEIRTTTKERSLKPRIITLYSRPDCQPCKRIKAWWQRKGVEFTEINVEESPDDLAAIKALGYERVPVTIVSTGDPEMDLHWGGLHVDNMTKYTLTTAEQKAA